MDKSCKNCSVLGCLIARSIRGVPLDDNWHCSEYVPEKKTVKLYAYLKEDDGHELIWHTNRNLRIERFTRVPSEDKEIEI